MLIFSVCLSVYISIGVLMCFIYINLYDFFEQYLDLRDRTLNNKYIASKKLTVRAKEKILDACFIIVLVLLWPVVLYLEMREIK